MPVAYITGATSGIGRATAERFIEEGWTVVAMARREERLQELQDAHPGSVHCFKLDVRDKAAVEHVFSEAKERFGAPDVLVNNAGLALGLEPAQACSLDDWDTMVDTNIKGLLYCTRAALPGMVERRHGSVLNLSSVAAFSAGPRMCLYYASKEFVRSFSEAVAEEVRSTGVTVTALCPGPTATGFEQAAQMKNSHMFSMFKPASAAAVAEAGFRAAQKGKTLRYCGWPTHTVSIAARLLPRSVCRRFMMKVNG